MKKLIVILALGIFMPMAIGAIEVSGPIYSNVVPDEGSIDVSKPIISDECIPDHSYIYQVDMEKLKKNSRSSDRDPLFLQVYNPETKKWIYTGINTAINGSRDLTHKGVINYKIDLAKLGPSFLGLSRFRFVDLRGNALRDSVDGEPIEFIGPRIVANLRNERYNRVDGSTYSYSVWVRSEDSVVIGLYGMRPNESTWELFNTKLESNSRGWIKLEWKNAPYYKMIDFKVLDT